MYATAVQIVCAPQYATTQGGCINELWYTVPYHLQRSNTRNLLMYYTYVRSTSAYTLKKEGYCCEAPAPGILNDERALVGLLRRRFVPCCGLCTHARLTAHRRDWYLYSIHGVKMTRKFNTDTWYFIPRCRFAQG